MKDKNLPDDNNLKSLEDLVKEAGIEASKYLNIFYLIFKPNQKSFKITLNGIALFNEESRSLISS